MKEEASIKRRIGGAAVAAMMLMSILTPVSYVSADSQPVQSPSQQETDTVVNQKSTAAQAVMVTGISLNRKSVSRKVGAKITLKATVTPSNATNKSVTWRSSNPKVAAVSQTGVVTAKGAGKATITAICGSKSVSCQFQVNLSAPTKVRAVAQGITAVKLKWKKTQGADGYQIYRANKKNGRYKKIATVKGAGKTSYVNKKRTTGKKYYYKVRAYSGKSYSPFSKKVLGRAKPLKTTVKLKAGEEKVKISWKKVKGAQGYHIYRSVSKKGTYKRIQAVRTGNTTSFTNTELKGGKRYYYKVRAYRNVKGHKVFSSSSEPIAAKAKKVKLKTHKKGFQYKKKFVVKAYAYTGGGRTAMGTRARRGAIAVDPRVIPMGTDVYVEGYGHAKAEDTGGNIKGKTIDLYMGSRGSCMKWGVRYKTIYVHVKK